MLLGVNIDHVATLRNARGGIKPSVLKAAEISVAERTLQVTPRKPDKHGSTPCVVAFTLQGIEDFVDPILFHRFLIHPLCLLFVLFVYGDIALALLHTRLIAFRNLLRYPSCDVLGSGIERKHLI